MSLLRTVWSQAVLIGIVIVLGVVSFIFGVASIIDENDGPNGDDRPESYCDGNDKVYIYDGDIQVMPASIDCVEGER